MDDCTGASRKSTPGQLPLRLAVFSMLMAGKSGTTSASSSSRIVLPPGGMPVAPAGFTKAESSVLGKARLRASFTARVPRLVLTGGLMSLSKTCTLLRMVWPLFTTRMQ